MATMDPSVEGPDVCDHLMKYSNEFASMPTSQLKYWLESKEFTGWWSQVLESTSLTVKKALFLAGWQNLMRILAEADVSGIEHLNLVFFLVPRGQAFDGNEALLSEKDVIDLIVKLGTILESGRFSGLKTLRIVVSKSLLFGRSGDLESIAEALRRGQFTNLRTLSLPQCDVNSMLEALTEGGISQLTSLSIMNREGLDDMAKRILYRRLDAVLKRGHFKSLQHLDLSYGVLGGTDGWEVFARAVKSGNLPNVTSLRFRKSALSRVDLADLVMAPENWLGSLESLSLDGCGITSGQVCSLVDAVIHKSPTEASTDSEPKTQLGLKKLDLHDNNLDFNSIDALIRLADSGQLPQLQKLDLSKNVGLNKSTGSESLITLTESIQRGCLPSLRRLNWDYNKVYDATAQAIVDAYCFDQALTTEIRITWDGVSDISLGTKLKKYRDRNMRLVALRDNPNDDLGDFVCLRNAKVFFCGYPEVGKTRLRKTLLRHDGKRNMFVWEKHPIVFKEPRTRGIELSRMEEKRTRGDPTTLLLWDLAGQQEYHVLHGTFLAGLGLDCGQSTTFVLVFKAPFENSVEAKLMYWLGFVASSSVQRVKRHVVIVVNCFHGHGCSERDKRLWMALIVESAKKFSDSLDIRLDPFFIDARTVASVRPVKDHLFHQAQMMLQGVGVPRVCFELQDELKHWSHGEPGRQLPILTWQAFEEGWAVKRKGNEFSSKALKTAASYLHELGEIIYLEEREVTTSQARSRSIVVPDPEWFCRQVVGELLLPKEMLEGGSSFNVGKDGSISVVMFRAFFQHLLVEGTESDDIIAMLELMGLCYRKGREKLVIPALIREDDYSSIDWEGRGFHRVMGRCLATEDQGRNVIPMTLFRRLQVELAQDRNFGGRGDSDYRVGKSFSSFKVGALLVLIQFDVDHSDPTDDRIDILVKGLKSMVRRDPKGVTLAQVKCICDIMQILEDLCVTCCPGLKYDIKLIEPNRAADRATRMSERKLMSLKEIKDLLVKGEEHLSWQVDGQGQNWELKSFLSETELRGVVRIVEREYDENKLNVVSMGLLTEDSVQEIEASEEERTGLTPLITQRPSIPANWEPNELDILSPQVFHDGLQKMEAQILGHFNKQNAEILMDFRLKNEVLAKIIQQQQGFSIEEKEGSVPRYMFLMRKQGQSKVWIPLKEAFKSSFELHMLCEAHFDDEFLHEVEGQEGIQLRKPKQWLMKVSPVLRRSLKVAVVVGKTVGNLYLPGVFNFLPEFNAFEDGELARKAVDDAVTMMLDEDDRTFQDQDDDGNYGNAADPINLKERLIAQEVVKDLISELGHAVFAKKIGLRKVLLRAPEHPRVGSSKQAQPSVVWICDDCYQQYGDRATDISPRR